MTERSLGKKGQAVSELKQHLTSITIKQNWQTPKIVEMDYTSTTDTVAGSGGDLGGYAFAS